MEWPVKLKQLEVNSLKSGITFTVPYSWRHLQWIVYKRILR